MQNTLKTLNESCAGDYLTPDTSSPSQPRYSPHTHAMRVHQALDHDPVAVFHHGPEGDMQLAGNLLVQETLVEERKDFDFAR